MLRFVPFFPPIGRVVPYRFFGCRSFCHTPINTLPSPGNAFEFIIFRKSFLPKFQEKTCGFPFAKIAMNTAGTPVFTRQGFPLNSCAQDIDNRLKNLAGLHWLAPGSLAPLIFFAFISFHFGDQWFYLAPQEIADFPCFYAHIPSIIMINGI